MNIKKPKIIVILGQTATGKSDIAVQVAKNFNGEIISADSRQVYTGLDLGTGKITKKEMAKVPHYLLNVANSKRKFTVSLYQKLANKKIEEIINRGKVPIICGGTGFYLDAIIKGIIFPEVPPNNKLRKELEKESTQNLFNMLHRYDLDRSKNIDSKNRVRLIRAIEIAKYLGKVPRLQTEIPPYDFLKIGLKFDDKKLKERIKLRLIKRLEAGMLNEVKKLHKQGLSWKRMAELGLEYRYLAKFLQEELSKEEMFDQLNNEIWQFAKRQNTYFKKDTEIQWFNPLKKSELNKINNTVKKFLK